MEMEMQNLLSIIHLIGQGLALLIPSLIIICPLQHHSMDSPSRRLTAEKLHRTSKQLQSRIELAPRSLFWTSASHGNERL
jgi:hypothetical protein